MNKPKIEKQYKHTKKRLWQRYNIILNKQFHHQLVRIIQTNKAQFVKRQSNRLTLWNVPFNNQTFSVVYDKNRKVIVTALPILTSHNENLLP